MSQNSAIINLRKYQQQYEDRMMKMIKSVDEQSQLKQADYKECEELSREIGRMNIRWKRLTSLIIESIVELETALQFEQYKNSLVVQQVAYSQDQLAKSEKDEEEEIKNMDNLIALMKHFIGRAEQQQQQQESQQPQDYYPDPQTDNDYNTNQQYYQHQHQPPSRNEIPQYTPIASPSHISPPVTGPITIPVYNPSPKNPTATRRLSVPRYFLNPSNNGTNNMNNNNNNPNALLSPPPTAAVPTANINNNSWMNAGNVGNANNNNNYYGPNNNNGLSMEDLSSPVTSSSKKFMINGSENIRPINRRGSFTFQ